MVEHNINRGLDNLIYQLQLFNSDVKDINIRYPSAKGTSKEIMNDELNLLKEYLGEIKKIGIDELSNCYNKTIVNQCYKSNCWWIGKQLNFENNKLSIEKAIHIERNTGNIYNASPGIRDITCENKDTFYLVSNGR